jgi:hypothetical protein
VLEQNKAIERASDQLGIDPTCLTRAWLVELLDQSGKCYYLAEFLIDRGLLIAAIDGETGLLRQQARLASVDRRPIVIDAQQARELAHAKPEAPARLVWKPCEASFSPFYPIWEVEAGPRKLYIDQEGRRWNTLNPKLHPG